ncbi:hypothetical protein KBC55_00200 [Patescibacteria group bacterium]|nr:hypothetical protein [Patescibacteria group bacterium]
MERRPRSPEEQRSFEVQNYTADQIADLGRLDIATHNMRNLIERAAIDLAESDANREAVSKFIRDSHEMLGTWQRIVLDAIGVDRSEYEDLEPQA